MKKSKSYVIIKWNVVFYEYSTQWIKSSDFGIIYSKGGTTVHLYIVWNLFYIFPVYIRENRFNSTHVFNFALIIE